MLPISNENISKILSYIFSKFNLVDMYVMHFQPDIKYYYLRTMGF